MKKRLHQNSVTVNHEKCVEQSDSLKFLGFIFSKDGIQPDPSLLAKISQAPTPTTNKELQSFLGLVNYYGRFIENFAALCAPLHDAKESKDKPFNWTSECQKYFELLKQKLTTAPVVQPFSLQKHSVLTVDASQSSIGAVLSQDSHPVIYVSRKLSGAESRYSNIEREALAVVWACKRLEHFLLGKTFTVQTDHKPLVYILGSQHPLKVDISARLMRFAVKMMHFDYTIEHLPGKLNVIADTLSILQTM